MAGWGTLTAGGGGLFVGIPGDDWSLLLRRRDFGLDVLFLRHHDAQIHCRDIELFVPNWAALQWIPTPDNVLSKSESSAIDGDYQVTVMAEPESGKRHDAVIAAFLRFMARPGL